MYLVMKGMKLKVQLINQFKLIGISDNFGEIVIKTRKTYSKKDFYKIGKGLIKLLSRELEYSKEKGGDIE